MPESTSDSKIHFHALLKGLFCQDSLTVLYVIVLLSGFIIFVQEL